MTEIKKDIEGLRLHLAGQILIALSIPKSNLYKQFFGKATIDDILRRGDSLEGWALKIASDLIPKQPTNKRTEHNGDD